MPLLISRLAFSIALSTYNILKNKAYDLFVIPKGSKQCDSIHKSDFIKSDHTATNELDPFITSIKRLTKEFWPPSSQVLHVRMYLMQSKRSSVIDNNQCCEFSRTVRVLSGSYLGTNTVKLFSLPDRAKT